MKKQVTIMAITVTALFVGCGYSQRDTEVIGQVKKIHKLTPLICPERIVADISLGVMRGGTGSMSNQDKDLLVTETAQAITLKEAAEKGKLVKITYNVKRLTLCDEEEQIATVSILE